MVINVPLSLPPAPCLNGVYGYSPRCSRDLPKVEDPPPTQQRRGGGPWPGQGSREKLGLSQGEGSPQAASQHVLGAGTAFGELVPPTRCSCPGRAVPTEPRLCGTLTRDYRVSPRPCAPSVKLSHQRQ